MQPLLFLSRHESWVIGKTLDDVGRELRRARGILEGTSWFGGHVSRMAPSNRGPRTSFHPAKDADREQIGLPMLFKASLNLSCVAGTLGSRAGRGNCVPSEMPSTQVWCHFHSCFLVDGAAWFEGYAERSRLAHLLIHRLKRRDLWK